MPISSTKNAETAGNDRRSRRWRTSVGIMLAVLSTVSVLCAYLMVESKDYKMDAGVHTND